MSMSPRQGRNPTIRLMQAVRYAHECGLTPRDIRESVEATLEEPGIKWKPAPSLCEHPPARVYAWVAHDGTMCAGCGDCGKALAGAVA